MACFVVSAASYLPFIGVALWILPRGTAAGVSSKFEAGHHFEALGTLAREPFLRGALFTAFFSGLLCGPVIAFCPVLVRDAFHGGVLQFSLAIGAFGCGGLLGALGLLGVDAQRDRRGLSSWFAAAFGLTLIAVAKVPWFWALAVLLTLGGMSMSITNTSTNTIVQTTAPAKLRGQAVSLYMLVTRGGIALGSLATGYAISLFGIRPSLLVDGVLAIAAQAVISRSWSRVKVASQ